MAAHSAITQLSETFLPNVKCARASEENEQGSLFLAVDSSSQDSMNSINLISYDPPLQPMPNESASNEVHVDDEHLFGKVQTIRNKFLNQVFICHLNVNSLSSKFQEVKELQRTCRFDVLVLSETKLDGSYKQETLEIDGYSCVRQDKRSNSGGLLAYLSNDIPFSQGSVSICNDEVECISIELNISEDKIMLLGMYKNPKTDPVIFKRYFQEIFEKLSESYENIILIGDLNFNMLHDNMLSTLMPSFNLTNVINDTTCHKSQNPTLIDVMLVTKRRKLLKSFSENVGISDFHNLIGGILKKHKPAPKVKKITKRQLARIDYEKVALEMSEDHLTQMIMSMVDVNEAYDSLQQYLQELLNKHAPKKVNVLKRGDFHCMTNTLRKAILYRNQLRNKYYKYRSSHYLSLYRAQRNQVTAIKRNEMRRYFEDKCKSGTRNKDFWKTVKPLFSKSRTKTDSIPLRENGSIITNDQEVCEIFNNFFSKIGSDIGFPECNDKPLDEIITQYDNHDSIRMIRENVSLNSSPNSFIFKFVSEREVKKILKGLSGRKAAGYDEIPAKFVKGLGCKLVKPLTCLINRCIMTNTFPNQMKRANITPIFKKKDKLNKDNYRSVNLLPVISKIFEKILYNQIYEYISPMFHNYLSGFRKGFCCQDVLIRLTEDLRESLDEGLITGLIAIDLSKAFDCMPHGLLLAKLAAYGFSTDSCELLQSYIMKRMQRVKIGETFSQWVCSIKGVPQGSILGPLLFNVFINDLLSLNFKSKIYNYADDNTLSCSEYDISLVKNKLQTDCESAMKWFQANGMKANANKFQLMYLSRQSQSDDGSLHIQEVPINATNSITILGVELDNELKFTQQINEICSQTGKQINAMKRLKNYLTKECKLIIYNSYVNSNFNYCSVVWMFTSKSNVEKLENTNKRALRFATNKEGKSYEEICQEEKELTVNKKCIKSTAILMFKVINSMTPNYVKELFAPKISRYNMRDNNQLVLPRYNTVKFGKNSLKYFAAKLWNDIPTGIKNSPSLNTFKSAITEWLLTREYASQ